MVRILYQCLLRMHPPAFRERFAGEMLEIFDASESGARPLLLDGLASLGRQWLLRNDPWRIVLVAAGALLEAGGVALLWWRSGP